MRNILLGSIEPIIITMDNTKYYYQSNSGVRGPISADKIKALLDSGLITMDTMVAKEGDQQWTLLNQTDIIYSPMPSPSEQVSTQHYETKKTIDVRIVKKAPAAANFCYLVALATFLFIISQPLPLIYFAIGCTLVAAWIVAGIALTQLIKIANRLNRAQEQDTMGSQHSDKRAGLPTWVIVLLIIAGLYLINMLVYIML